MIDPTHSVEVWQSIIKGWERMFLAQIAETEKWHGKYIDLLKEKIAEQNKQIEEFAR